MEQEWFKNSKQNNKTYKASNKILENTGGGELETASSVKAYWTLAKMLEGIDEKSRNGRKYEKTFEEASSEIWDNDKTSWLSVIKEMGEWYVDNVYTYQIGNYGAKRTEQVSKEEAREKLSEGNVIRISDIPQYIEDEQQYQDEYKYRFNYFLGRANEEAVRKREQYLFSQGIEKEHYNDICKYYNIGDIEEYNVDILKDKELVKYEGRGTGANTRDRGHYDCPLIEIKNDKNIKKYAYDDCSGFMSSVIYRYLNNILKVNGKDYKGTAYKYDSYMSSSKFSGSSNKILETIGTWFDCYEGNSLTSKFNLENAKPLQTGDIMVREGHVEIYLNPNWSFGWGEVHNSYEGNDDSKAFRYHMGAYDEEGNLNKDDGYYFYNINNKKEGKYTKVYRLKEDYRR